MKPRMAPSKERSTVILQENDRVLLIRRVRDGVEYFVFPGGGIEEGETPEAAAVREMKEETNLEVILAEKLFSERTLFRGKRLVHYFLSRNYTGKLSLDFSEEMERSSEANQYYLEWHPIDALPVTLQPSEVVAPILACLRRS